MSFGLKSIGKMSFARHSNGSISWLKHHLAKLVSIPLVCWINNFTISWEDGSLGEGMRAMEQQHTLKKYTIVLIPPNIYSYLETYVGQLLIHI